MSKHRPSLHPFALLLTAFPLVACAASSARPAMTPPAKPPNAAPDMPATRTPAAPTNGEASTPPAAPSATDVMPELAVAPSWETLPPLPAAAAPSSAPPTALAPLAISMADELPFVATSLTTHTSTTQTTQTMHSTTKGTHSSKKREGHGKHARGHHRPNHPDPGIVVEVTSISGDLSQVEVQRLARANGYWPFRHCYEEGLQRDQQLAGRVAMDLVLAADGTVTSAQRMSNTLADESVSLCVVREAAHLAALGPSAGADAGARTVSMQVALAAGDAPVPVPRPAPHAEDLREALRAKWSQVEKCYAQGLERHRDLGGRLSVRFKLHASGEIEEAREGDTRFADVDVTRCILGVYRATKLPRVGHSVEIVYAMHFESKPADGQAAKPS
jgi:hypothetical protein